MKNAFDIVKDFENAVAEYTGAPYCVAVNSCTNALFLALKYNNLMHSKVTSTIEIPAKTYIGVPQQIIHAGYTVSFNQNSWRGAYKLEPLNIWDSARKFTSNMYKDYFYANKMTEHLYVCTSHHWSKILGVSQMGCILHDNVQFDTWVRKARFDGRTEGVPPKDDSIQMIGWHMYVSPEVCAEGLVRLMHLPKHNADLPNSEYADLSTMEIFR